jgi:hypothetical protein
MPRKVRAVPLCERHVGCPTCKAKPREQCRTVGTTHPGYPPGGPGYKTAPHAARWRLYAHLWRLA